jgi:hypothetical protein
MTSRAESDVTSRFPDDNFLFFSIQRVEFGCPVFISYMHFSIVNSGGFSILAARECNIPEVTSMFDRATMVSY